MTTAIESTETGYRDPLASRLTAPRTADRIVGDRDRKAANSADYDYQETRRQLVHSRHSHYDPLQVAIEDGLEAWARHAMASNGFADLP